ncbi:hypothetical protein D9M68_855990 [compost metagenome]
MRDALASSVSTWQDALRRSIELAIEEGHLSADTDGSQVAFEIHGLILALHYEARFLRSPGCIDRAWRGFAAILERNGARPSAARKH